MTSHHTAVWIDHEEAQIFDVAPESFEVYALRGPRHRVRRHPTVTHERERPAAAQRFYRDVVAALAEADEILIVGPGLAKVEFVKYVHEHASALTLKIVGVESADHPTPGQLAAYARKYFRAADRMRSIAG
jgi:stalled ribosome rescue protein Dom34